jgi:hypothetical protein
MTGMKRRHDISDKTGCKPTKHSKLSKVSQRCEQYGSGPVLKQVIDEVIAVQPKHADLLNFFIQNCQSYGWNDCSCEFSEDPGSVYIVRHGASSLCDNILHFVTYFMPRKMCTPSKNDYVKAGAALRAVIKKYVDNGHLVKDKNTKHVLRQLSVAASFNGPKILDRMNDLFQQRWWRRFENMVSFLLLRFISSADCLYFLSKYFVSN